MPNWIEGSLKIRGSYNDILNFFNNGIQLYRETRPPIEEDREDEPVDKLEWLSIIETGEKGKRYCSCAIGIMTPERVYIEGTKRAFIKGCQDFWFTEEEGTPIVVPIEIEEAWGFHPERWVEVAKRYGIDIHLWGLECGMRFGQDIEIINGEIVKNEEFKYKDWLWECPFPWMGG